MDGFISVDWGTTNLRMYHVALPSLKIIKSTKDLQGIKRLNLKANLEQQNVSVFLKGYLLMQLQKAFGLLPETTPIVISGMASSKLGLFNLPYAKLPQDLSHPKLQIKQSELNKHPLYVISGLSTEDDILRGEETQLIGLHNLLSLHGRSTVIIPGTHSKHMHCEEGYLRDFETFMTGEVFEVLTKHSLLESAVAAPVNNEFLGDKFKTGLYHAKQTSLLHNLFTVRVKQVLEDMDGVSNYFYLSGLLIGAEILALKIHAQQHIYLFASGALSKQYEMAIEALLPDSTLKVVSLEHQDHAFILGQYLIYKTLNL